MWVSNGTAALFHDEAQQRLLLACFGVSIALHALLLFAFPGLRPGAHPDDLKVLTATFAPRPVAETVTAVREPQRKPPERQTEARPPLPLPALTEAAVVASQPVAPASPQAAPSPPSVARAEASHAPETASSEAAAKPLLEGFDASVLDAYRLALIDAAKRYRRYPVQAMERGWQGRVEIRVVIGADGMIKRTLVKTSSSYQILDDQALDMVKRALTQIPSGLHGREFILDIPVIFELQTG
jgi:protein TonB